VQLEKLGPVNPLAVEEHEEETKRLDFLTTQRNDLSEAKNKLHAGHSSEIDSHGARAVSGHVLDRYARTSARSFITLFGGGECDLRLENPERAARLRYRDPRVARAARRPSAFTCSRAGERALVALSLLFGIFLTKPSPFCLLDEVDAPLDDQNVGRFVKMLNKFKQSTQFIVITHNPRTTTEAADAVYGVTMQEPGVSSLVSVRMNGPAVDDTPTAA
jgi:chromosome segregation protein